jgi:hypothetical protein
MYMKIYDCFPFYNEFDLLEIRLRELYDVVDHFVLVESNTTFTSRDKPFYYQENADRYKPWADKIIHVQVEDMPRNPDAWVNDIYQRNQIFRGIEQANPNDLIMISDCDEIIRADAVRYMINNPETVYALRMPLYNFRFNNMKLDPDRYGIWAMAGRRAVFDTLLPDSFRQMRFQFFDHPYQYRRDGIAVVEHAGWHFGYMGDRDWLVNKAQSFAHQEVNYPEFIAQIDPEASVREGKSWARTANDSYQPVQLDSYFPRAMQDPKFSKWVIESADTTAVDLLPPYCYN